MTDIELEGVALRTHDVPYPFPYEPYGHQIRFSELVDSKESFVAVNDAPTGGGKTSSWLAPALDQQLTTVAIYPTNALVEDQYRGIEEQLDAVDHDVEPLRVTGESLSTKQTEYGGRSKGETLNRWYRAKAQESDQIIVLTNPDIFVMMCRNLYKNTARAYKRFELAVVDEFHRAGLKQQYTLQYLLDELIERDNAWLRQIVFLSATPSAEQETLFEQTMVPPYYRVTADERVERTSFMTSPPDGWQAVMPPVDLDVRTAPTFGTADVLTGADAEATLSFCQDSRTVIMLDGIHEVQQVFTWLDNTLNRRVERIDGLHSDDKRDKLESFDVLVSNSAVEVGIDFDVERIIFAGQNRDRFLQRLGRLRTETETRRARCYVPTDVQRTLNNFSGNRLIREDLAERLEEAYPSPREPDTFDWRYSASEAREHLQTRLQDTPPDSKERVEQRGLSRIYRHFLAPNNLGFDDMKRVVETVDWKALRELQWYRGTTPNLLVWDVAEETLRTYSLFYLLRYGDIEFYNRTAFERRVPDEYADAIQHRARYVDGFCTYHGTIDTTEEGYGRSVAFTGGMLAGWIDSTSDRGRKPAVRDGLEVWVNADSVTPVRNNSVDILNRRLRDRADRTPGNPGGFLCFPISGRSDTIKSTFRLDDFFFLYPIEVGFDTPYCLALGSDAVYLHCHVQERSNRERSFDL